MGDPMKPGEMERGLKAFARHSIEAEPGGLDPRQPEALPVLMLVQDAARGALSHNHAPKVAECYREILIAELKKLRWGAGIDTGIYYEVERRLSCRRNKRPPAAKSTKRKKNRL
jgi:hypothetical protein